MNDRLQFSQRVQLLESAARAAIAYDKAIKACANSPELMYSWSPSQGRRLDVLYADWISKSRAALAVAAAPVLAQEPFMFAIMTPDGSAHMDENCVGPDAASLYSELNGLNDSPDAGYAIVPLYRFPVQPVAVPCASSNAEHELHSLRLQVYEQGKRLVDDVLDPDDIENIGARLCALTQVCTYCHGGGEDGDDADANGEGGWIGRCGKCGGTGINIAAPAAQGEAKELADKVVSILEGYADNYDMMSRIGKTGDVNCKPVAHDIRRNMVDGVRAAIADKAVAP